MNTRHIAITLAPAILLAALALPGGAAGAYLCVPLVAQGISQGLLHVRYEAPSANDGARATA